MEDIIVGRLMSSDVVTVTPGTGVEEAAQMLLGENIGSVVVVDEAGKLKGILTSTDFVQIVAEKRPKDDTAVMEYMTEEVVTTTPHEKIRDAADRFITYDIHHLPVVDSDDHVVGMLSTTDLTAYISGIQDPSPDKAELGA